MQNRALEAIYELALNIHKRTLRIESWIKHIMADLTALQAAVANETTVDQSVETLLTTLAAELATANENNDQAAIDQIVQTMQNNATQLAAAVTTNTQPNGAQTAPTSVPPSPAAS